MRNVEKSDAVSNSNSRISSPDIRIKNLRDNKRKSINTNSINNIPHKLSRAHKIRKYEENKS